MARMTALRSYQSLLLALSVSLLLVSFGHAFAPASGSRIIKTSSAFSQLSKYKLSFTAATSATTSSRIWLSSSEDTRGPNPPPTDDAEKKSQLPMLLDPGTKGGALFLSLVLFVIPLIGYQVVTNFFGVDEIEAGKWIGVGFTLFTLVLWVSTYIFRVATKDMTYAKQLKDYENAVIAKRLEELDEDEVQALMEDIEREKF